LAKKREKKKRKTKKRGPSYWEENNGEGDNG
jgi:hypothetical protein